MDGKAILSVERKVGEVFVGTNGYSLVRVFSDTTRILKMCFRGRLIVADGIRGIYRISADGKEEEMLVPSEEVVAGRPIKFVNSVSLATDGAIYYTSLSSRWNVADGLLTATSMAPTGRVLRYDPKRKASEVLVDGLSFANGIVLSHKEDFLLYAELGTGQ